MNVSAQVGGIPQADVTLPPDVTMRRIGAEDRVRVTVCFQDYVEKDLRLLFEGEIVRYSYATSSVGRSLTYTAVDMIAVLTHMFPLFIGGIDSLLRNVTATQQNAVGSAINPYAITHTLFTIGLSTGEPVTRPYDVLLNVVLLLLGEGVEESARSVVSTHWFTRWLERTKFLERIVPSFMSEETSNSTTQSAGFPILEAAQNQTVLSTLAREGDEIAMNNSYYTLIQTLFQRMYYEVNPVLAPPCLAMNGETRDIMGPPSALGTEEPTMSMANPDRLVLGQHVTQPKNFFGLPPKCNVFFPSMVEQHSYEENFATQPTRTYLGDPEIFRLISQGRGVSELADFATTVGYPPQAHKSLQTTREEQGETNPNNFLVYPEEFFRGPVYNKITGDRWFFMIKEDEQLTSTDEEDRGNDRIQKIYAAMEHYRKRLSTRNGSVSGPFNPYVLLAHPCAVLDDKASNHHTFGYVVSVSHSLTQNSMSTRVFYSYGQTFEEFFETYLVHVHEHADAAGTDETGLNTSEPYMFAPFHPIKKLRDMYQRVSSANEYFGKIYWRGEQEKTVFDWFKVIGVIRQDNARGKEVVDILNLSLENSNAITNEEEGITPKFWFRDEYAGIAMDLDQAMRYVHRPVCTVEEFIDFQGEYGTREGLRLPKNPREGKGAPYYVKILNFVQGPGEEMGETATGDRCGVMEADTRRNWEARFLRFRDKVYYSDAGHRA